MITIKVGDTPLYIPKETTLTLEQHNNSFDIDNLTSDIIWTFDIPARPNAVALDNAHFVYISNHKKYRCTIGFNGIVIATGDLYIQSVTDEKKISCGVVLDGLGEDFANRKLKENDYGEDVVISQPTSSLETHRANWLSFLQGSLDDASIYKFFLFTCENFYKNNDAYGYYQNKRATLRTDHDEKFWCAYVNRLFIYYDTSQSAIGIPTVGNLPDTSEFGIKLFNTLGNNTDKLNGFAFAPALRLDWLVKSVLGNAGYRVTGDFLENAYIKKLYLQSLNAMDADMTQFGVDEYLYVNNAVGEDVTNPPEKYIDVGVDEISYKGFKLSSIAPVINFRLNADVDSLTHEERTGTLFSWDDEAFFLWVAPSDAAFPRIRCTTNSSAAVKDFRYAAEPSITNLVAAAGTAGYGSWGNAGTSGIKIRLEDNGVFHGIDQLGNEVHNANFLYGVEYNQTLIQLTETHDNQINYEDPEHAVDILGNFTASAFFNKARHANLNYTVRLVKAKISAIKHTAWNNNWNAYNESIALPYTSGTRLIVPIFVPGNAQLEYIELIEVVEKTNLANTNTSLNVFDTMLRWHQHVPNVTNGDFLKKICKFFGLSMYVNPFLKTVQLSFANNLFKATSVDISQYIVNSERMTYEPKRYEISTETVLSKKSTAEDFLLDDVVKRSDLENARTKKRMSVFVANENAYNTASKDDTTGHFVWSTSSGNDKILSVGNDTDEKEEVSMEIAVPNMRVVDVEGRAEYLCDIACNGNSKLFDDDYTGEFDMILQQYKGQRFLVRADKAYYIEDANPTSMSKNGVYNETYLDLAAVGKNAAGEKWLRKLYNFKSSQENYRFTARLPLWVFFKVYNTQMPQDTDPGAEVRWIMINNRKYMPLTISYEFGSNDTVLATIECARQHFEM